MNQLNQTTAMPVEIDSLDQTLQIISSRAEINCEARELAYTQMGYGQDTCPACKRSKALGPVQVHSKPGYSHIFKECRYCLHQVNLKVEQPK